MRAIVDSAWGWACLVGRYSGTGARRRRDVLVQILRVGVCGTDREVMAHGSIRWLPKATTTWSSATKPSAACYALAGCHARRAIWWCRPCAAAAARARRATTDRPTCASPGNIRERGIVGLHGFLAEQIVDHEDNLIPVPPELAEVAPLVESLTPEKALRRIANARAHLPVDGAAVRRPAGPGHGQRTNRRDGGAGLATARHRHLAARAAANGRSGRATRRASGRHLRPVAGSRCRDPRAGWASSMRSSRPTGAVRSRAGTRRPGPQRRARPGWRGG